jgi:tripartite ATP-independent transporter DctP family solute receptor
MSTRGKKLLTAVAALMMVSFLLSVGVQAGTNPVVIRVAETQPLTSAMTMHISKYGEMLKEKTKGRITVQVFPGAMLGPSPTVAQQMQLGAIDQFRADPALLFDFGVKSMQVMGLPYIFTSMDHAHKVAYGPVGQRLLDDISNSDVKLVGIGYMIEAPRHMFLRNKKVIKLSDAKGLKIRVPENKLFLETMAAFGISGTPVSMGEVYSALQTGVVDGAENSLDTFNVNKFHEVCKYITLTGHIFGYYPVTFSKLNWQKLSADDQALIKSTWKEASLLYDKYAAQKYDETVATIKKNGVEILNVDNPKEWQDAVVDLQGRFAKGFEGLLKEIKDAK